ncbi:TonB-dependent receptor domain-containing protein [Pelagicoccus mobilis]|uniref:TonB-dependent receptor n=1 Tax=Pelagicoccus mobilis TaxID=415221 RepID=A0A934RZZ0_9BACT|nr:TonB-dependent receptor [Pelagicoccus mobilis]MBK1876939.1 TonB-dependent receptor [Pelagicoccus mobilis]
MRYTFRIPTFLLTAPLLPFLSGQDTQPAEPAESEAIISDREKVELVEDSNVSEAISRRPDLKFNNVTIDGEKANGSLSELPSEAVDSLEVLRAITPDLDADARGGSLNVESKPIFLLENSVTKMEAELDFDEEGDSWGEEFLISTSRAQGDFGYRLSLALDHSESYDENLFTDWEQDPETGLFAPEVLGYDTYHGERQEISFKSRVDYRISDSLYTFARLDYVERERDDYRPRVAYRFDQGEYTEQTENSGQSLGAKVERELLDFDAESENLFWQLGTVYEGDRLHIDAKLSIETNSYFEPNWFIIEFDHNDADLSYRWDDPSFIEVNGDTENPADFDFDELLDERWNSDQDDLIATLNLKRTFQTEHYRGFFKSGLKYRARDKEQSSDSLLFSSFDGDFNVGDVGVPGGQTRHFDRTYDLGIVPDADRSRSFYNDYRSEFPLDIRRTREKSDGNSFQVSEDVSSGYAMLSAEWGAFRSIVGGRVEQTEISYQANEVVIDEEGDYLETVPRSGDRSYSDFFPSFHLRYFLNERTTLIGAWTKSIKRPGYGSVVPYRRINYGNQSIEEGSPDLEPTLFDNLDFSLDYELSSNSTLSLELFNRDISDLVYWENTIIDGGTFDGFELGRNRNGPSATRTGVNIIWNQSLQEWGQSLEGFSINVKASSIDSESDYPNRPDDSLPTVHDSDFSIQVSATYDKGKTFAQLLFKERDDYLTSVDDQSWRDRYEKGRDVLDFSATYQVQSNTRLFFEAENLLASPRQSYIGDFSRPVRYGVSLREYSAGVKMNF